MKETKLDTFKMWLFLKLLNIIGYFGLYDPSCDHNEGKWKMKDSRCWGCGKKL